jgi:hypothetical protein
MGKSVSIDIKGENTAKKTAEKLLSIPEISVNLSPNRKEMK